MNCGLRIADCGFNVDCGFLDCGVDCGLIADWNPRSAVRDPQSIRNPQSAVRNDEGDPK